MSLGIVVDVPAGESQQLRTYGVELFNTPLPGFTNNYLSDE